MNDIKLIDDNIRIKNENTINNGYYINKNIWISNNDGIVLENNKNKKKYGDIIF